MITHKKKCRFLEFSAVINMVHVGMVMEINDRKCPLE